MTASTSKSDPKGAKAHSSVDERERPNYTYKRIGGGGYKSDSEKTRKTLSLPKRKA